MKSVNFLGASDKKYRSKNIVIIGGPAAGKTCLAAMMIKELKRNNIAIECLSGFNPSFHHTDDYATVSTHELISHIPATAVGRPNIYRVEMIDDRRKKRKISLIDISFEELANKNILTSVSEYEKIYLDMSSHQKTVIDGLMLVIDPLGLADNMCGDECWNRDIHRNKMQVAIDILTHLDNVGMSKTKIAIVFTKTDEPEIRGKLGEGVISDYLSNSCIDYNTAVDRICKSYLLYNKQYEFLNYFEFRHTNHRFFVSGIFDDHQKKESIVEPLVWLTE